MNFEYIQRITDLLTQIDSEDVSIITKLAEKFADAIINKHIIHAFGTGHSHIIGIEMFARAGGLANVNAILDPDAVTAYGARRASEVEKLSGLADIIYNQHKISSDDIMVIISNSGRNALPVEMAMRAQKEGVYTIALTNLTQSRATTSRHHSGKKLYECADLVIDTHVPSGDAMIPVGNIHTGPASSIVSMCILNTAIVEALKLVYSQGGELPVFQSQNVDGFDNDALYEMYEDRVKHF